MTFRKTFQSPHKSPHNGKPFTVVGQYHKEVVREFVGDPDTTKTMFLVRFPNGETDTAWGYEILNHQP